MGAVESDRWRQATKVTWRRQFNKPLGLEDPAFGINWFEVVKNYCRFLNQQVGILEEEQWYAARSLPADESGLGQSAGHGELAGEMNPAMDFDCRRSRSGK